MNLKEGYQPTLPRGVYLMSVKEPKGAIGYLSGTWYKLGRFGKAYYWNGSEWIKSCKPAGEVMNQINLAARLKTKREILE